jgi:hypothetical protein
LHPRDEPGARLAAIAQIEYEARVTRGSASEGRRRKLGLAQKKLNLS